MKKKLILFITILGLTSQLTLYTAEASQCWMIPKSNYEYGRLFLDYTPKNSPTETWRQLAEKCKGDGTCCYLKVVKRPDNSGDVNYYYVNDPSKENYEDNRLATYQLDFSTSIENPEIKVYWGIDNHPAPIPAPIQTVHIPVLTPYFVHYFVPAPYPVFMPFPVELSTPLHHDKYPRLQQSALLPSTSPTIELSKLQNFPSNTAQSLPYSTTTVKVTPIETLPLAVTTPPTHTNLQPQQQFSLEELTSQKELEEAQTTEEAISALKIEQEQEAAEQQQKKQEQQNREAAKQESLLATKAVKKAEEAALFEKKQLKKAQKALELKRREEQAQQDREAAKKQKEAAQQAEELAKKTAAVKTVQKAKTASAAATVTHKTKSTSKGAAAAGSKDSDNAFLEEEIKRVALETVALKEFFIAHKNRDFATMKEALKKINSKFIQYPLLLISTYIGAPLTLFSEEELDSFKKQAASFIKDETINTGARGCLSFFLAIEEKNLIKKEKLLDHCLTLDRGTHKTARALKHIFKLLEYDKKAPICNETTGTCIHLEALKEDFRSTRDSDKLSHELLIYIQSKLISGSCRLLKETIKMPSFTTKEEATSIINLYTKENERLGDDSKDILLACSRILENVVSYEFSKNFHVERELGLY